VLINQLGQAQMQCQGGRKDQPSIGHQTVVVAGRAIASKLSLAE
jgi:hypothetical protein